MALTLRRRIRESNKIAAMFATSDDLIEWLRREIAEHGVPAEYLDREVIRENPCPNKVLKILASRCGAINPTRARARPRAP
jgi:hypothetical protein